jgi:hypothetical protein
MSKRVREAAKRAIKRKAAKKTNRMPNVKVRPKRKRMA